MRVTDHAGREIAWQMAPDGGRMPRWSLNHWTLDDRKTLCGKLIPVAGMLMNYRTGGDPGLDDCQRCQRSLDRFV